MTILTLEVLKNGELADVAPLNENFETLKQAINAIETQIYDVVALSQKIGNLFELETSNKSSLVEAINEALFPVGVPIPFPIDFTPAGFVSYKGQALSRTVYARLYNLLGTTYGAGDGVNTFNVPDMRAKTVRGYMGNLTAAFGVAQEDALQSHTHTYIAPNNQHMPRGDDRTNCVTYVLTPETSAPNGCRVANETRMKNYAVNWCARY